VAAPSLQLAIWELVAALHKKRNGASTVDFTTLYKADVDLACRIASAQAFGPFGTESFCPDFPRMPKEPIKPPRPQPRADRAAGQTNRSPTKTV
jgi:hypothetical protein